MHACVIKQLCFSNTWGPPPAVYLKAVSLKCINSCMAEESWGVGFFFLLEFLPNEHFGKQNAHPRKTGEFYLWSPCFQNLGVNYLSRFKDRSSIEICWCSNSFRLTWGWKVWPLPLAVSILELAWEIGCAVAALQLHLLLFYSLQGSCCPRQIMATKAWFAFSDDLSSKCSEYSFHILNQQE